MARNVRLTRFANALTILSMTLALVVGAATVSFAQTKITFMGFIPPHQYGNGFQVLVDEFNSIQSEVEVELQGNSSPSTLLPLHAGGLTPDLIYDHLTEQYLRQGVLAPIDQFVERSGITDWIPGTMQWHTYDGHLYGAPYGLLGQRLILYDRDRFAENGVSEPQEGWNWNDLESRARRLSRDTDGDGQNDVFGFDMAPSWFFWPALINNGSVLYDGERWFPHLDRTVEAIEFMTMLAREGIMAPDGGRFQNFHDRRTAISAASSRDTQLYVDDPPAFEVGAIHFPVQRSRGIIVTPRAFYLGNTNDPVKQAAAWKFVRWALEPEQQVKFLIHGSLLPSTLAGMQAVGPYIMENDPLLLPFANEIAAHSYPYPFVANFSNASAYTTEWMNKALAGDVSPREAAEQITHLTNAAEQELRAQSGE